MRTKSSNNANAESIRQQIETLKNNLKELQTKARIQEKAEALAKVNPKDVKIVKYSDKSILIYKEGTRCHVDALKDMGARFNPRFIVNDKRVSGWILPSSKVVPDGTMKDKIAFIKNALGI